MQHLVKGPGFRVAFVHSIFTYGVSTLIRLSLHYCEGESTLVAWSLESDCQGLNFWVTTHPDFPRIEEFYWGCRTFQRTLPGKLGQWVSRSLLLSSLVTFHKALIFQHLRILRPNTEKIIVSQPHGSIIGVKKLIFVKYL